uniref:Immunoglobulin subtype domain-containing protein n=1 Tax=Cyprinodon variegatus TaxID=28743 RepID=A0A3Q2EAB3_CYPVA
MVNLGFLLFSAVLSCLTTVPGLIHHFGYEGRDEHIQCSYPLGYEGYEKYLCKNNCGNNDVLISTLQKNTTKYRTYDEKRKRVFIAIISKLHLNDAGKFWCGVTRPGTDIYTEVKLCCQTVSKTQSIEEGSVTISCPYDSQSANNLKYLCRGNRPSVCLKQAVITSNSPQEGRFRLTDDRKSRIFTVTISRLTLKDSGLYLCGVKRTSDYDLFSAVELDVKGKPTLGDYRIFFFYHLKKLSDAATSILQSLEGFLWFANFPLFYLKASELITECFKFNTIKPQDISLK